MKPARFVLVLALLALVWSCHREGPDPGESPLFTQAEFEFSFPTANLQALTQSWLEVHLESPTGSDLVWLDIIGSGHCRLPGTQTDTWEQEDSLSAWRVIPTGPWTASDPLEGATPPSAQPPAESGPAPEAGDTPATPPSLLSLGFVSTDGFGDGWTRWRGGSGLFLDRSALGRVETLEFQVQAGRLVNIKLSLQDLEGGLKTGIDLTEIQSLKAEAVGELLGPMDQGIFIEINGGEGYYSPEACTVEVLGRPIASDRPPPDQRDTVPSPEPAPEASPPPPESLEDPGLWYSCRLRMAGGILSLEVNRQIILNLELGPGFSRLRLLPQGSQPPAFRRLVLR